MAPCVFTEYVRRAGGRGELAWYLGPDYDVAAFHAAPSAVAAAFGFIPDGDLFQGIAGGQASSTDEIEP